MRIASEPYITWYSSLPTSLQDEIVYILAEMMPNHRLAGNRASNLAPDFIAWIRASSQDRFKAAGVVLALIKLTEFVFIDRRGTNEDWDIIWNRIELRLTTAKSAGNQEDARGHEANLLRLPDRAATWLSAAEEWRKLRRSLLSEDAISGCVFRRGVA